MILLVQMLSLVQIGTLLEGKSAIIFLPINLNMCLGRSKEPSNWDDSFA